MTPATPDTLGQAPRNTALTLACFVIILAGARAAAPLLVPFLLALFIAIICASPVTALGRRGMPTWIAGSLVATGILGLFVALFVVIGSNVEAFSAALPVYQEQFRELLASVIQVVEARGVEVNEDAIRAALDPGKAMGFFANFLGGVGETLSNILLILFTVIFLLLDASKFPAKVAAYAPDDRGQTLEMLTGLARSMNDYVVTKAMVSALTGVLIWLGLLLLEVEFASLWGFLAFGLNFVPNIGSIIAAVPVVLLSLLQLDPGHTALIIGLYVLINLVVGNVIEPTWMGQRVGLSTLTVFVSLIFWGWMFGPVGMLLSVPLTMSVKFAAEQQSGTAWLALLLASAPPGQAATGGDDGGDPVSEDREDRDG